MAYQDCGHDQYRRRLFAGFLLLTVLVLLTIFLFWAILRPTKPHFILQAITVDAFKVSSPNLLTSNIQLTISSRNPNYRIGVYYEKLDIYVSYRNQQITLPTRLPTTYQGHKDMSIWSPFLYGNTVPVSPFLGTALRQDVNAGTVLVNVKIQGKVKWKVGIWISAKYNLFVNCPVYLKFGNRNNDIDVGTGMKYTEVQSCSVEI